MVSCLEGVFIAKEKLVIYRSLGPCPSNPSNPQTKGRSTDIRGTCKSEEEARRNKKPGITERVLEPLGRSCIARADTGLHEATEMMMVKVMVVVMMGVFAYDKDGDRGTNCK